MCVWTIVSYPCARSVGRSAHSFADTRRACLSLEAISSRFVKPFAITSGRLSVSFSLDPCIGALQTEWEVNEEWERRRESWSPESSITFDRNERFYVGLAPLDSDRWKVDQDVHCSEASGQQHDRGENGYTSGGRRGSINRHPDVPAGARSRRDRFESWASTGAAWNRRCISEFRSIPTIIFKYRKLIQDYGLLRRFISQHEPLWMWKKIS